MSRGTFGGGGGGNSLPAVPPEITSPILSVDTNTGEATWVEAADVTTGGGAGTDTVLGEVDVATAEAGDALTYDGTKWIADNPQDSVLPPNVPTGLVATPGDSFVDLTWNPVTLGIAGYRIFRNGTAVQDVTTTSWRNNGLQNGTAYTFTVVSIGALNKVSAQSPGVISTPIDNSAPDAPTSLQGTAGDTQIALAWLHPAATDIDHYNIYRDGVKVAETADDTVAYTDTGRTNGVTYVYRVSAVDTSENESALSSQVSIAPVDQTPPPQVTGLTGSPGDTQVTLNWTAITNDASLAGYKVYRNGTQIATVTAPTTTRVVTGLTNGVSYSFYIRAYDGLDNTGVASSTINVTPVDTAPAAPTGLAATPSDAQVALTWNAVAAADLASYRVYRDGVLAQTVTAPTTNWTDTGRTNSITYSYYVTAVDAGDNESATSNTVNSTPTNIIEHPIVGVTSTALTGSGSFANIYDGDENTIWHTNQTLSAGAAIVLDLGSSKEFKRIRVRFESSTLRMGTAGAGGLYIFTSDTGAGGSWTNRGQYAISGEVWEATLPSSVTARYVHIENNGTGAGNTWGVREAEVFTQ